MGGSTSSFGPPRSQRRLHYLRQVLSKKQRRALNAERRALKAAADAAPEPAAELPAAPAKKPKAPAAAKEAAKAAKAKKAAAQRPPEPAEEAGAKKRRKTDPEKAAVPGLSPEAQRVIAELEAPGRAGTLSDRLNPTHPRYDASLKAHWKKFSKKERELIVAADKRTLDAAASARAPPPSYPFQACADDHCETGLDAYKSVAPLLTLLASALGKSPATLRIYDPFYCTGSVVEHLGSLGFKSVHNKCEDFYAVIRRKQVPEHDVLLTNPPYSGSHVEELLRWSQRNGKPSLLLMPSYVASKPFFKNSTLADSTLFLCPKKRFTYWTPKGLRSSDKVQAQHSGRGGNRTAPWFTLWFVDLGPVKPADALLKWWRGGGGRQAAAAASGGPAASLCRLQELPPAVFQ